MSLVQQKDCRRCAHLTAFTNCGAILLGLITDRVTEKPYMPGALFGPPNPTAWVEHCGNFIDQGYQVSLPRMGKQWE